ncbi:MAG: WG repeat-containing protein [Bacteroidetes bacterium]|nr:WG repeat-containing protein [Bacteroidota bacterium]
MRKRIFISLALALVFIGSFKLGAQNLYPILQNGLWGYMDSAGIIRIAPQFQKAGDMENGIAKAISGQDLIVIYNEKRILKLEGCSRFDPVTGSNFYKIQKDHQWWLADRDGNFLSEEGFDRIWFAGKTSGKFIFNSKGNTGLMDSTGRVLFKSNYFTLKSLCENIYSVTTISGFVLAVDENGNLLMPDSFKNIQIINPQYRVFKGIISDGSFVFFDANGNLITRGKRIKWDALGNDFYWLQQDKKSRIYDMNRGIFIDSLKGTFASSLLPQTLSVYNSGKAVKIFHRYLGYLSDISNVQFFESGKISIFQNNGYYGLINQDYKILLEPKFFQIQRINDYNFMVQDSGFNYKLYDGNKQKFTNGKWYSDWSIHKGFFKAYTLWNEMDYIKLSDSGFISSSQTYFNVQRVNVQLRTENNAQWTWNRPAINISQFTGANRNTPWFQGSVNSVAVGRMENYNRYGLRRLNPKTGKFEVYRTPVFNQVIVLPDTNLSYAGMPSAKNKKIPVMYCSEVISPGEFTIVEESTGKSLIPYSDYIDIDDFKNKNSSVFRIYRNGKMHLISKVNFKLINSALYISKSKFGVRQVCITGALAAEKFNDNMRDLTDYDLLNGLGLRTNRRISSYSIRNGDWRLLLANGNLIKPAIAGAGKIIFMGEFRYGFAIVMLHTLKCGVIDSLGNTFIPAEYDIVNFSRDIPGHFYCGSKFNRWGLTNQYGDILLQPQFHKILPAGDAYYGWTQDSCFIFNTNGIFNSVNHKSRPVIFENETGFLRARGGYKITNDLGNSSLDPLFQNVKYFHNGYAPVNKAGRWGMVDENGRTTVKFKYSNAKSFQHTAGIFEKNIRWIFVNREGERIQGPKRADAYSEISPGVFIYFNNKRSRYAMYDGNGKKLSGFSFSECPILFQENIIGCKTGKVNFYTLEGKKFATMKSLPKFKGAQFTFQNALKIKIKDFEAYTILKFSPAQLRAFGLDSPWNELVIPLAISRDIYLQKNYLFEAYQNDLYQVTTVLGASFVNGNGENVMNDYFSAAEPMHAGVSICTLKNGNSGILNAQGFWILAPEYGSMKRINDSVFAYRVNYEYDIFNEKGEKINEEKIDGMHFTNGLLCIRSQSKLGYYNPAKRMVWELQE